MVIHTLFAIRRQSSPMAGREINYGYPHPFCYAETIGSDGTRRQIMVICTLFVIQRQSSMMARGDKLWSSAPFLLSGNNEVWWHVEINYGDLHPFYYPETIKSNDTQRQMMVIRTLLCYPETIMSDGTGRQNMVIRTLFAIQRQSSMMACRDKLGHPHPFCYPETIKSDGMSR